MTMSVSTLLAVVMGMLGVVGAAASNDQGCQQVKVAVTKKSIWTFNCGINTLKWETRTYDDQPIPQCQCPTNGGLGDVTSVQTTDNSSSGKIIGNDVCSGCNGGAVLSTSTKFCSNPSNNGANDRNFRCTNSFGPCDGVKVYRCACRQPTTKAPTASTSAPKTSVAATSAPKTSAAATSAAATSAAATSAAATSAPKTSAAATSAPSTPEATTTAYWR